MFTQKIGGNFKVFIMKSFNSFYIYICASSAGPKGHRFKPGRGVGFLMAIKIHSTPSFG
jgi:hypothetical protein